MKKVILCALVTVGLLAQNTPSPAPLTEVVYMDSTQMAAALAKTTMISRDANHIVAGGRRDGPSEAERHEKAYDLVYVTDGEATYVTGGRLVNSKETGPGEMFGGTIEGGVTRQLKKGDLILVPPTVPHWWKDTKGVSYIIVKMNKP
jgi:uncharacterized RmlC-like cupin family protein